MDQAGEIVDEVRVENANLDEFAQQYVGSKAAIEATSNYYTIYDQLDEHLGVVVADPYQTKAIGHAAVKNDRLDAKLLAYLRRAEMIAESYVPPEEIREQRALVRARKRLVEKRTDFKSEVHAVLDQHGATYTWDPFREEGREILASEDLTVGLVGRRPSLAWRSMWILVLPKPSFKFPNFLVSLLQLLLKFVDLFVSLLQLLFKIVNSLL